MAAPPINAWKEHKRNKDPTNTTEPQDKLTTTAKITRGNTIPSNTNSQYSEFIELTREIQLINKTCNLSILLKLVRELRGKLKNCITKIKKFQIFLDFTDKIEAEWTA